MLTIKRALAILLAALLLLTGASLAEEKNLLENGSFESVDGDGLPSGWYTEAWVTREGVTDYSVTAQAHGGQHAAVIESFDMNDARFAQNVQVKPNTMYRLSGYIKAEGIEDSGRGANLSIEGLTDAYSQSVYADTEGEWQYVELYGETGDDQKEVTVFVRLGGYSGESIGRAVFDDISLVKVEDLPVGEVAKAWYSFESTPAAPVAGAEEPRSAPAWPLLLVIACAYAAAAVWLMRHTQLDRREEALREAGESHSRFFIGMPVFAVVGLLVAAGARIIVALNVTGYQVDVNCFTAWGNTMANVGPALFYQSNSWCDYTPGYIYIMGVNGALAQAVSPWVSAAFVHKLLPMACDLIGAVLVYRLAVEHESSRNQAGILALLMAFNPATALNSAAWCQIDSVLCVLLMAVAYLALRRKWAAVLPVYVLTALVKPQALMLGFLGLAAIIMELVSLDGAGRARMWKQLGIGLGVSAAVALVIVLPFSFNQKSPTWLFKLYGDTLASYPYATVNAANLYYLFDGNWDGIANPANTILCLFLAGSCIAWGVYSFLMGKEQKPLAKRVLPYL